MNRKPLSIYIHVPFCVQKCAYCDFCSFPQISDEVKTRYTDEIVRRILTEHRRYAEEYRVETVYFGGGTPTLLSGEELGRIVSAVRAAYDVAEDAEITAECNPGTVDLGGLSAVREAGINRLSVGVQSTSPRELSLLGRIHTAEDFYRCAGDARAAGFSDLSFDVMFGIPEQTVDSFRETLSAVLSADPTHISAYGLKIEDGTPFGRRRSELVLPDEDAEDEMYADAVSILSAHGLDRYEISNFAREGYRSRHNYAYWTQKEYLGYGISAHSYYRSERFAASRDLGAFLAGEDVTEARVRITPGEERTEFVMLRMRLAEGVSRSLFDARYGRAGEFEERYGEKLRGYIAGGFVTDTGDGYAFTTKGFRVSNYILSEIL